jgi:hypothetical protein
MAIARQLTVTLPNRPGALANLCSELARRAVNIQAIHAVTTNAQGHVRVVVGQPEAAARTCRENGWSFQEEDVLTVRIGDRPGSLGKLTRKLGEKGVNINYAYGSITRGATQALIVLGVNDAHAAAKLVK